MRWWRFGEENRIVQVQTILRKVQRSPVGHRMQVGREKEDIGAKGKEGQSCSTAIWTARRSVPGVLLREHGWGNQVDETKMPWRWGKKQLKMQQRGKEKRGGNRHAIGFGRSSPLGNKSLGGKRSEQHPKRGKGPFLYIAMKRDRGKHSRKAPLGATRKGLRVVQLRGGGVDSYEEGKKMILRGKIKC